MKKFKYLKKEMLTELYNLKKLIMILKKIKLFINNKIFSCKQH